MKHLQYLGERGVVSATYSQIIWGGGESVSVQKCVISKGDKMLTFGESGKQSMGFFMLIFVSLKLF